MLRLLWLSIGLLPLLCAEAAAAVMGAVPLNPCTLGAKGAATVRAQCGTVRVPEDREKPQGRMIELAIAVVRSTSDQPEPDAVAFIAGGPGQSALQSYPSVAPGFAPMLRTRHVVLVDQRGVGGSNPLHCPPEPEGAAQHPAAWKAAAVACRSALEAKADLRHYTTVDAAHDLDAVREALGISQLNVVGMSYGTRVAQAYLRLYETRVRSLILDGVVPPGLALGADHARNLERALDRIFDHCRASTACGAAFPDSRQQMRALLARLERQPLEGDVRDPRTYEPRHESLNRDTVATLIRLFAYTPETAALLPLLLDEAAKGNTATLISQGLMLQRQMAGEQAHGMELSVACSEDAPFLRSTRDTSGTVLGDTITSVLRAQCAVWPTKPIDPVFRTPVKSSVPALLISGEWDPVTPPEYGTDVRNGLRNSRHVSLPGRGHLNLARGCLPRIAADLVKTLDATSLVTQCAETVKPSPAFINFQGPPP